MASKIVKAVPHLNIRSGPGTAYRAIGHVPNGTVVNVLEKDPAGTAWVYIAQGDGWVSELYLGDTPKPPPKTTWRVAESLTVLLNQVNALAPSRSKATDGTIGDFAHANRKSDHNPNVAGVVTALDITHDPDDGCDCGKIAAALVASKDPRIKYLIWNGRIVSSVRNAWVWRKYGGSNQHRTHLHISVASMPSLYDDTHEWRIK